MTVEEKRARNRKKAEENSASRSEKMVERKREKNSIRRYEDGRDVVYNPAGTENGVPGSGASKNGSFRRITRKNRRRLGFGAGLLVFAFIALIFRMGYWQIYKSDELRVMANDMQKVDTEIEPVRGSIYDSQMSTLAESVTEYELYAYTQSLYKSDEVDSAAKTGVIDKMSKITGKDRGEIKKLLEDEENLVLIAEGLTREQVERAEEEFEGNVGV